MTTAADQGRAPFWGPLELARLALVRADVVAALTRTRDRFTAETGHRIVVIRGWVSLDEQEAVYDDSLTAGYRAAPAQLSYHPLGAAADVGIVGRVHSAEVDQKDPLYATLARIAESEGLRAGFHFKRGKPDPYHFEARETIAQARTMWKTITRERLQRVALIGAVVLVAALFARRIILNRQRKHVSPF